MSKNVESPKSRPFPWKCVRCGERTMMPEEMDYSTEIVHDGRTYQVSVPALRTPRCQNPKCRAILLDTDANRRITQAFRSAAGLLEPEEIRRRREGLGLTQAALAERLEVGPATVSRWETGAQIQQRSLDQLLRLYFDLPEVRRALEPPPPARFPHLNPTRERELRRQGQRFQLTAARRCTVAHSSRGSDDEMSEAVARDPAVK
jgi:putative zinc finger/helix-turn-helix YgiT family protein